MPQPVIVALAVVLGVVVLGSGIWVPLLYWLAERRARRRFDALAAGFGLPAGGKHFSLNVAGRAFGVTLHDPGRSSPRTLEVALSGPRDPAAAPILLRPESRMDRLGKRLGLNREVQIGERTFDEAVYIESDAPDEAVRSLLGDEGRRRAVIAILGAGYSQIEVHGLRGLLAASRFGPDESHYASRTVEQVAAALAGLAAGLPERVVPTVPGRVSGPAVLKGLALVVGVLVLCVLGFGALGIAAAARDAFRPLDDAWYQVAVPAGFGVLVALLPAAAIVLRGKSDSFRSFVVAAAVGAYVVPCYTAAALLVVNGVLDVSKPVRRPARVTRRWQTTGKGTHLHLEIQLPWRRGELLELDPGADLFGRLANGQAITVTTGEGALGWQWIQSIEPAKR